tara:strand:- start:960 stop:1220 length:261 start_codon:yes stop_codon:yes gene_type:complete
MSNTILTPDQIQMAEEAEPAQILAAIHKRVVDTEKLMMGYRNHSKNLELEICMLKERIEKLEKINEDEDELLGAPYTSVYGEDEAQ